MLGKQTADYDLEYIFLYFPENKFWHLMQIVSRQFAWNAKAYLVEENETNILNLLSAEFA